ncbi:protein of unknown function (plasmid) [Cupriavidus taiwanensis]|uniref:Uncharacterized protein n=1 Tax=Cupriavidus taiwanensis TaxID=164546 RepID=A0A375IWP0_9BURK|nr:protein of unknown function [Cupriavidus taiwanensis]
MNSPTGSYPRYTEIMATRGAADARYSVEDKAFSAVEWISRNDLLANVELGNGSVPVCLLRSCVQSMGCINGLARNLAVCHDGSQCTA